MSNHVTNALVFQNIAEFNVAKKKLLGNEGHVDFNILLPQPDCVYLGNLSGEDSTDFGAFTWYNWNSANWNTKWNAYDTSVKENRLAIRFDTAWSPPRPVVTALSKYVPNFLHYYVCETTEYWGKELWVAGSRNSYWKDDPATFGEVVEAACGKGAWIELKEDYANDGEEWPPDHVINRKPTIYVRPRAVTPLG